VTEHGRAAVPEYEATVVVPCWNEEESLPSLIERLDRLVVGERRPWEVVFVDDGSRDRTAQLLEDARLLRPWLRLLRHQRNLGIGAALRTAFGGGLAPIVCTLDSDCTYPPERLPDLIAALGRGADLATGSPWHPDNRSVEGNRLRVALSRGVSRLYRWVSSSEVYTFTCLFRAYRRDVVEQVEFNECGFAAVTEILVRAVCRGYRVAEVPMPLAARRQGASKMNVAAAIGGHLKLLAATARWARSGRKVRGRP
jgi:dolichol-phosphate mannosyltransferase